MNKKIKLLMLTLSLSLAILFNINVNAETQTKSYLESPLKNGESYANTISIHGWVMSEENGTSVKIYIDDNEISEKIIREQRKDVIKAIKGYGNATKNPTPGYIANVDLTRYSLGNHTLKVNVLSSNGNIISTTSRTFTRRAPVTKLYQESPYVNGKVYAGVASIHGWVMSEEKNVRIRMYMDGKEIQEQISRVQRKDVLNAIKGYGDSSTNQAPGYVANINLINYSYGNHTLRVDAVSENGNVVGSATRIINVRKPSTKLYQESPYVNGKVYAGVASIHGWVMSEEENVRIRMYMDGKEIQEQISRVQRKDVLNAIKGYGDSSTNQTPGYVANIDLINYSYGNHTLRVDAVSENGNVIDSATRIINVQKPSTKLYQESPYVNGKVYREVANIHGWVMSEEKNVKIRMYMDGKEIQEQISRVQRKDVLNAIKGYGDSSTNETPGYVANINLNNYSYGNHALRVDAVSENGNVIDSATRTIVRSWPKSKIYIDTPDKNGNSYTNTLNLTGWVMSEEKDVDIKFYVDNVEVTGQVNRISRPDVLKAIKGYGTSKENPNPGFSTNIDLTNYKYGNHTIRVDVKYENYTIVSINSLFKNDIPSTKIEIDSTNVNINSTSFNINGWLMTDANNYTLAMLVDGKKTSTTINRTERQDVLKSIKGYGDSTKNKTPGYNATIDLSSLKDGKHTIEIGVYSKNGELIKSKTRTYTLKKYLGQVCIDSPSTESLSASSDINVFGWVMSTSPKNSVKIYIDNKLINENIERSKRDDVINVVKNYGDATINPTPGYNTKINLSDFSQGYHTITVILYNNMGEYVAESTKRFYLYKKMLGIDVSYHQKNIDWKQVKNSGAVDFAMIRIGYRGYVSGSLNLDKTFAKNINDAYNNGIKVGVYFFSQATNYNEGVAEAKFVIDNLSKSFPGYANKLSFPIVIDTEYSHVPHDGRADNIGKNARTDAILGFCNKIKESGLKPMVYSNPTFIKNELDISRLNGIDLWLAHYTGSIDNASYYSGPYFIWQYSNNGTIPGINNRVDLDVVM